MLRIPVSINSLKKGYLYLFSANMSEFYKLASSASNGNKISLSINGKYLGEMTLDTKYYRILLTKKVTRNILQDSYKFVELKNTDNCVNIKFIK